MTTEEKTERPISWATPDESKRLVELGIPLETADCYYFRYEDIVEFKPFALEEFPYLEAFSENRTDVGYYPCWTLGALLRVLNDRIGSEFLEIRGESVIIRKLNIVDTGKTTQTNVCRNVFMYHHLIESVIEALAYVLKKEKTRNDKLHKTN